MTRTPSGFSQWNHSWDSVVQLMNRNTLNSKVYLDGRVVSIGKVKHVTDSVCGKIRPGTVMKSDENVWQVAAADGAIQISDFFDETGELIEVQKLADQCLIMESEQLPILKLEEAECLAMIQHFAKFEACQLSCFQKNSAQSPVWAITDFQKTSKDITAIELVVAWLIYIARDTEMSQLQIGWDVTEYFRYENETSSTCAKSVPFGIFIDVNEPFSNIIAGVKEYYQNFTNYLLCLSDTLIRHILCSKKLCALAISLIDMQAEDKDSNELAITNAHGSSITLQINKQNGAFRWIYDKQEISEDDVNRISLRLIVLLASAKSEKNAKKPAAKLNLLPKIERHLLLYTWNQTTVTDSPVCYLHQLFEAQVENDGQAIAVECEGKFLSYAQLNTQANQLAHYLIAHGVKPDDRVAICFERSTTIIVAILGILKAGCAYVPLDPAYSSRRLTNILLDADPKFLLTNATGRHAVCDHRIPMIDLEVSLPSDLSINNPDPSKLGLTSAHLAYVIYTSGSTGIPKGVMVEHQQVVRLFKATEDKFDFNKLDKRCLFHSVSFDVSVWEIWSAFYYGSHLSIIPNKIAHSSDEFYDWICDNGITVLNQTPSTFKMLMLAKTISSRYDRLRYIIFVGEELDPLIANGWNENSETVLIDMYGPTEATVLATFQRLEPAKNIHSIGRPLPDLRVYLLDSYGEPVPLGAEGEIYISGAGVARGYLNQPELTKERFLPDPFNKGQAARMYRTGDRARYLPDGNLVYLGRKDQQLKIRGYRIELNEIESRLVEHPQVHEAVVQSYGEATDTRLVAYVVADAEMALAQNLRTYLSILLPDYMIPAAYVRLPSMPLTPNGKLDRRALPAPDDEAFVRQRYEAPKGELEEQLAQIWRELLNIDRISRHDNFFALGGHSLLVVNVLTQLRQIGLDCTVRDVFAAPTLTMLASMLVPYQAVNIPPNLITEHSIEITPEMLPLITLSQSDIDAIIAQIPGGVANIQDIYGLTPLQNGLLFHHLMAKGGDPYLLISRMRFNDHTSLERYANTLQQVIKRHDILRTAFFWDCLSEPAQVVLRQVPSLLIEVALDESDEQVLEQLSQKFKPRHYRLNLSQAPLMRLLAASESDGSWVALQLLHHTIIDNLMLERMQAEIHAIFNGKNEMLKSPTSFRSFVTQTRQGISTAEHKRFFSEMLGDIDEPTLPFGLNDISLDGSETKEAHFKLPQTLNDQLRMHARNLQVSLASICHLAWAQVLARASGREAVVFGTVLLGRSHNGEESNSALGPMINTLPIRLNIDERSVEGAVHDTHAQLSALLAHEHAPLALAQCCSGVSIGLPLFSALLNYRHNEKIKDTNASIPGVSFLDQIERTNYPLGMALDDDYNNNSLSLSVQVVSPISPTRICAYMQQSLESLAYALAHTPQQPVRALTVMPLEERTLLLHNWNQTMATTSSVSCLHQLFEMQVASDEQAIAVEYEGTLLSYSELNSQANQLAHSLIAHGVKPDDRIALCAERSLAMIVAILGILKAGCAYVPLDPAYPSQRLTNTLLDADPVLLLADHAGREALGDHPIPVIEMEKSLPSGLPIDNPNATELGLTPAHLAYIIYTSGSTGTPKGVMVEHQQIFRLFEATQDEFGFNKLDKWCLFHSISFDVSVWEMWSAFWCGGQLSIVPYNIIQSINEFNEWICSNGITVLNQTPLTFKMLMRAENNNTRFDRVRYVFLGGEALDPMIVKEWNVKYDKCQAIMLNIYGPTEAVINATICICDSKMSESSVIPIGRPLANKRIYLLDSHGEPVLLGADGEIYIGGASVARGYLNRRQLTEERFLPDPFSNDPTARMYRTGDRARYLPDGNLVFLGRVDHQVKIRGFRIELGEIEACLVGHPQVHEAVVQSYGNGSQLVAYVVSDTETPLAQNLRNYLSALLPDYMIPVAYVRLPSFPLTSNGKLDRRALPAPDDEAFAHQQYEAPQGETEEKIANIWRELLNTDCIGRCDNFFELGGHSLLVMHFVNKAKLYNMHIDARSVFSYPILKNLADQITDHSNRFNCCDAAIPVRQYGNKTPLFMIADGGGDISHVFELALDIDRNIPVYALPWASPEKQQPSSIEEMATAMIPLIKKVQKNGPYAIAGYCDGGILAFEITKQLVNCGYPVSFLGLIDTYATIANPHSESEIFIFFIHNKFPVFKTFNDSIWWDRISELALDEAVEEIRKINLSLNNIVDIEKEVLLTKQIYNYQNLCASYKIDSSPIKIHLFRALDFCFDIAFKKHRDDFRKIFNCPNLGWENCNLSTDINTIPVDGNHSTMMRDPKYRSLLGNKLTKYLQ